MSSHKSLEVNREEFRKYLQRGGVLDALTKALVRLFEESEKPDDPLEYIRQTLEAPVNPLTSQLEAAKARIAELEAENATLKSETVAVAE